MAVSELPGNPNAVWTVKTNIAGVSSMDVHICFTVEPVYSDLYSSATTGCC